MSKITRSAISRKPIDQKKKKKMYSGEYIFTPLYCFGVKIQNTNGRKSSATFLTCVKSTLNGPANGPEVTYSKIQNRLSRAP